MLNHYEYAKKSFQKFLDGAVETINYDDPKAYNYLNIVPLNTMTEDGTLTSGGYGLYGATLWSLYYLKDFKYYHDESVLKKAIVILEKLDEYIYPDGSLDNFLSNYHDPAQSAFTILNLSEIFNYCFNSAGDTELEIKLKNLATSQITRMAKAVCTLGFHTPNHRWVMCAALSFAAKFSDDPAIQQRIDKFFAEGIDCDEYGEYTERSAGTYSVICDNAFIFYSQYSNTTDKLEYVRRNLNLNMSFMEPDNTIMSLNSTRQDVGFSSSTFIYYISYLYMALFDRNPQYAWIADKMMRDNENISYNRTIYLFLNNPEFIDRLDKIESKPVPEDRSIFLPNSLIFRKYMPKWNATCSVIGGPLTPYFFKLQMGTHIMFCKFVSPFFGDPHSKFRPQTLEQNPDGTYTLTSVESQGYRSPLDEPQGTPFWRHMDHSKRVWTNIQTLERKVTFSFSEDEITLDVSADTTDNVPCKFEFIFLPDPNGFFLSGDVDMDLKEGRYILGAHEFSVIYGGNQPCLTITGCERKHRYSENMKGGDKYDGKTFVVSSTTMTPCHNKYTIKINKEPRLS